MQPRFELPALLALSLALGACSAEDEPIETIAIDDAEYASVYTIDGDSSFWPEAPYIFETPFTCPFPTATPSIAAAHVALTVQNDGPARTLDIRLDGSSADSTLTAEPLLLVYRGDTVPETAKAARNCLDVAKPGAGSPGTISVDASPGDQFTVIALEFEIGPEWEGSGSGTFRLAITPQ